jgi:hypothetical protein
MNSCPRMVPKPTKDLRYPCIMSPAGTGMLHHSIERDCLHASLLFGAHQHVRQSGHSLQQKWHHSVEIPDVWCTKPLVPC